MLAFKEFANFINLNMANLAATYAQLLAENSKNYAILSFDNRLAAARKLLNAVAEALETQTSEPLLLLFTDPQQRRWSKDIIPPQPLIEIESLGQTLTPVVTNLDAGKFLWQLLTKVRASLLSQSHASTFSLVADSKREPSLSKQPDTEPGIDRLISERDLLRAVIDNLPDHIYVKDTEGRFLLGNRATINSLGAASLDELIGKTDFDFSPQELARQYHADEQAIFQSGQSPIYKEEIIYDQITGEKRWVSTTKVLLRDHNQEIVGLVGINHDITQRRQAEEVSQGSETRYRSLFEDSPISLWEEDFSAVKNHLDRLRREGITNFRVYLDAHPEVVAECALKVKIVDVNQATLELYKASSKEEFFAGLGRVFVPESFQAFKEELIAITEGKTRIMIEAVNNTLADEQKDLNLTWSVAPGYEDTLSKVLISIIDITEQKQAEAALREGEARYRSLFEDSPISLWEEDFSEIKSYLDNLQQEGVGDLKAYLEAHPDVAAECATKAKIVGVNKATLELFHANSNEEFFGGFDRIFGQESIPVFQKELTTLAEGQTRFESEAINYTLAGERKNLVIRAFIAPGHEENWSKILVTMIDITERKRLEHQVHELLERRTRQVETSTEVAQEIALAPVLADLFHLMVNLIQERFGYYHIQVYTLHEISTSEQEIEPYLVMQEGTGIAGQQIKEIDHKIALAAEQSPVTQAARTGEPILIPDVSQVQDWLPHPLLPETKAELAIPIKLGQKILGVLDIQNDTTGSLSAEDQLILMGLCGQIAVAINSRQIEDERERLLAEVERQARREQTIREITEKMRSATTLEELAKTTAEELGRRFSTPYALVELGIDNLASQPDQPHNGHS